MPQKKRGQTPVEEAVARILNALDVPEKTEEIPPPQARKRPLPCPSAGISVPAATLAGRWPRARLPAS